MFENPPTPWEYFTGVDGLVLLYALLVFPILLLVRWLNQRYVRAVSQYLQVPVRSGLTGADVAKRLLARADIRGVKLMPSPGWWRSNHYHPLAREVVLAHAVYGGRSLSAVGIAAHEVGHAEQHTRG